MNMNAIPTEFTERIVFGDDRIAAVRAGESSLTEKEREYLVTDTARFEECDRSETELRALPDSDLMEVAYWTWADYCRNQGLI